MDANLLNATLKHIKTNIPTLSVKAFDNELNSQLPSPEGFDLTSIVLQAKISASEEIRELLRLANDQKTRETYPFTLYPISTGNNWGYGSSLPGQTSTVIVLVDLSQLDDITHFDAENGLITVQPGVTQAKLAAFLEEKSADFMVPVTGAGPSCSILANALERGYGITPIADHFSAVTAIRGYLPNGDWYSSSISQMNPSDEIYVDQAYKWKHGPYIDGLFTQSGNLIATEMSLVLARPQQGFNSFYMRFYQPDSFDIAYGVVKAIFQQLSGMVGSINLMDRRRVCAMVADNPNGPSAHANMTEEQVAKISISNDVPEWTIVGTIYAPKRVTPSICKEIRQIAKGKADQLLFSSSLLIRVGELVTRLLPVKQLDNARQQLEKLNQGMQIMRGQPNQIALPLAYWRNPRVKPDMNTALNPAKDGCGLLWYAPLVPAKASVMQKFINMIRDVGGKHNIEPMITFTNLTGYCTDATIPIVFDRENPQAVKDAHDCLEMMWDEGLKIGCVPYRMNIEQQKRKLNADCSFWQTAKKIKLALDPNEVLSPARYNP